MVAVGTAAFQFAEMVAEGHAGQAVIAFVLAMFAISIAWISFSWFASAFATDDWLYRTVTMLQMIGVVVFSLGLPAMFHSVEEGGHLELRAMVIGYVVMRIAMVLQWWRAARQSPSFHDVGMANIRWTVIVQAGWIVVAFVHMPIAVVFVAFGILGALEIVLPVLTQGSAGGTPGTRTTSPNDTDSSRSSSSARASSVRSPRPETSWEAGTAHTGPGTPSPSSSPVSA